MMTPSVIYVPGLGDTKLRGQRLAVRSWRLWGVRPYLFQMNWGDDMPFAPKLSRLLKLIDQLAASGPVNLVGASAGATAVINAYAARPDTISGVVCIAGKINHPETIESFHARRNRSFWESAHLTPSALDRLRSAERQRILSIRSRFDGILTAQDSIVDGAQNRQTWVIWHVAAIASQITFGAPFWMRFLKAQAFKR